MLFVNVDCIINRRTIVGIYLLSTFLICSCIFSSVDISTRWIQNIGSFEKFPVNTSSQMLVPQNNWTLFICGYPPGGFEDHVFPEYRNKQILSIDSTPTSNDILIFGVFGPCEADTNSFPGKSLYIVQEPDNEDIVKDRETVYQLGPYGASNQYHYLQVLVISFTFYLNAYNEVQAWILDHKQKRISTRKHFLIYVSRNCQPFRDAAFLQLSNIQPTHQGGRCPEHIPSDAKISKVETLGPRDSGGGFIMNFKGYHEYRFCLVMENTKMDGYVTEKILLAFLGGCIPIYWGSMDVYKMFNAKAFIYYDIKQPEGALERVHYLENNETAYKEVMSEPILANGSDTIEAYFSMSDSIGGGKLKSKIRDLMEL